jgi:hypothetical protein
VSNDTGSCKVNVLGRAGAKTPNQKIFMTDNMRVDYMDLMSMKQRGDRCALMEDTWGEAGSCTFKRVDS